MKVNTLRKVRDGHSYGDLRIDDASFEVFFRHHYPRLCVYCKFKYGFDVELSEDL